MTLTITSLDANYVSSPDSGVPFIICNTTFRIVIDEKSEDRGFYEALHKEARNLSSEYLKITTIDDPEKFNEWVMRDENFLSFDSTYPGFGRAWVSNDDIFKYIEKFDTFWFRDYVSDSPITRSIIHELSHYRDFGKLPSIYRFMEASMVLKHIKTLARYSD